MWLTKSDVLSGCGIPVVLSLTPAIFAASVVGVPSVAK
jgi:hypothetical protein